MVGRKLSACAPPPMLRRRRVEREAVAGRRDAERAAWPRDREAELARQEAEMRRGPGSALPKKSPAPTASLKIIKQGVASVPPRIETHLRILHGRSGPIGSSQIARTVCGPGGGVGSGFQERVRFPSDPGQRAADDANIWTIRNARSRNVRAWRSGRSVPRPPALRSRHLCNALRRETAGRSHVGAVRTASACRRGLFPSSRRRSPCSKGNRRRN